MKSHANKRVEKFPVDRFWLGQKILMADSAQSMSSSAAARRKLFGPPLRPLRKDSETSGSSSRDAKDVPETDTCLEDVGTDSKEFVAIPEEETCREIWERRWAESPEEWRNFVSLNPKVFGLTEVEEEKIRRRNKNFVSTPPLSGNGGIGTATIIGTVGAFSKVFLTTLNDLNVYRLELLYDAIEHRSHSQGLLTFSNHQSIMDDPFLLAAILPRRILLNPELMRWGLCSLDICFQNALVSRTLKLGKALPIERRGGIGQSFLQAAAEKLSHGDWVHIYPEGRVRQSGMGYAKRGVGKLLAMTFEARQGLPLILPMYHEGIEHVMPQSHDTHTLKYCVPRVGKKLFVMAGEPIDLSHIFHRLMPACIAGGGTATDPPACLRLYEEVADTMAITMRLLRAEMRRKVRDNEGIDLGEPFELS